jgi:hypothetical protein
MMIEPHADIRMMAHTMRQSYQAFLDVGFDEGMAFRLTRDILMTSLNNNNNNSSNDEED